MWCHFVMETKKCFLDTAEQGSGRSSLACGRGIQARMEVALRWSKRIAVTCVVTGGVVYVVWKGFGVTSLVDNKERGEDHCVRKQEHYVRIQQNCLTTVSNLASPLEKMILASLSTESITQQLKETKEQHAKVYLWENLKVISFSRAIVTACVCSMLIVLVRIQFSIVAAYLFTNKESINEEIQRQYLSTIHQSLQNGLSLLIHQVRTSAEEVLLEYSLKHMATLDTIKEILLRILDRTAHSQGRNRKIYWLLNFMAPAMSITAKTKLDELLTATLDILEIEDTQVILEELVERALLQVNYLFTEAFHSAAQSSSTLPIAKIIPIISDNATFLLHPQAQRAVLQEMTNKDELMTLSRNCYEAFTT